MKTILRIIGILIMVSSVLAGLYVGCYIMFYGGIVQIINSINPIYAIGIASGICRIVFCELAAIIPIIGIPFGGYLLGEGIDI